MLLETRLQRCFALLSRRRYVEAGQIDVDVGLGGIGGLKTGRECLSRIKAATEDSGS